MGVVDTFRQYDVLYYEILYLIGILFFTVGNRSSRRSIGGLSLSPMSMSMTGPPSAPIPVTAGNQGKVQ